MWKDWRGGIVRQSKDRNSSAADFAEVLDERQRHLKRGPAGRRTRRQYATVVRDDDLLNQGESQSRAGLLGGKERLEDLVA